MKALAPMWFSLLPIALTIVGIIDIAIAASDV
jgi:hypothetical protein